MKKIFLSLFLTSLLFVACQDEQDPFLITPNSIGKLTKEVQIRDLDSVFPQDSIVKEINQGELFGTSTKIEVYDQGGEKMLLLEPVQAFDSTSTIGFIQVLDPRFRTDKGLNTESTFKDIVENYSISRIENTLSAAVIFIDGINVYVTIDKKHLPAELRYNSQERIHASQIPNEAKIKYFMIDWD